jgi:hypothetical protein
MLRVEPLLDELLDLPSGEIELAGYRGPDRRILVILAGGGELRGAYLIGGRRCGEDAGHLVRAATSGFNSGVLTGSSSAVCDG